MDKPASWLLMGLMLFFLFNCNSAIVKQTMFEKLCIFFSDKKVLS